MKIVVGLGNPGAEYAATRHNAGFMVVDQLAAAWNISSWRSRSEALVAEYRELAEPVLLVKPQTYMNLSGNAVGALMRWYKIEPKDVIVVYDDMDLPTGRLRLRLKGGSGGHRGIESMLSQLGSNDFLRVRVGIGRPPAGWTVVDYVLSRFAAEEAASVTEGVERAAAAVECIVKDGMNKAMNRFNV